MACLKKIHHCDDSLFVRESTPVRVAQRVQSGFQINTVQLEKFGDPAILVDLCLTIPSGSDACRYKLCRRHAGSSKALVSLVSILRSELPGRRMIQSLSDKQRNKCADRA